MSNTVKTLPVEVYRANHFGDCSNGGVSSYTDTLYLVCDKGGHELPETDPRLIRAVTRHFSFGDFTHVEPVNPVKYADQTVGPMFGGNFVYASDSRFPATYPLPIHDRYETQEQYDLLSH